MKKILHKNRMKLKLTLYAHLFINFLPQVFTKSLFLVQFDLKSYLKLQFIETWVDYLTEVYIL